MKKILFALMLFATPAFAHNGVKLEQDSCVFNVGPATMHFVAYQTKGEGEDLCQDIPNTGKTIFGVSAIQPEYRDVQIGVDLIHDGKVLKRIDPKTFSNATATFEYDFDTAGKYSVVVTVADDLGNKWTAEYPFTVGVYTVSNMIEYILYALAFGLLLIFLKYMLSNKESQVVTSV